MRKVCPQCGGKGKVRAWLGETLFVDAACLDCDETGYIDVPEDSNEQVNETANVDTQ